VLSAMTCRQLYAVRIADVLVGGGSLGVDAGGEFPYFFTFLTHFLLFHAIIIGVIHIFFSRMFALAHLHLPPYLHQAITPSP
jgi:vacuolar-type H+-ATPase subunit I/STV1